MKNIKGKFLLTINNHLKTRKWYKEFNLKNVKVGYSISDGNSERKIYRELIITNY